MTNEDSAVAGAAAGTPAEAAVTRLPKKLMTVLSLVLLTESICSTMLLPFVALFVAFLQDIDPNKAGNMSGVLISLFMLGQVISGKLWGYLSDAYGRKIPLLSGLVASSVVMFLFGISPNIYVCCVLRFLHGFFNGNVLVAKTVIADVTDKTNEAKGFAMVSIMWSLGTLFGPAIGGFLYAPAANPKWSWAHIDKGSFLGRHPAFLPSVVITAYTSVTFVACILFLEETNKHKKPITDFIVVRYALKLLGKGKDKDAIVARDVTVVSGDATAVDDSAVVTKTPPPPPSRPKLSYAQAFRNVPLRNVSYFYMLLSAMDMTYNEIVPLWAVASRSSHGLELFSDSVSILILSYSIPAVVANVYFHFMLQLLHYRYLLFWNLGSALGIASVLIVPLAAYMSSTTGFLHVLLWGIVRQVGVSWCYSLVHLLTAKCAPPGCVGAAYGVSQTFACVVRCIVPPIVSPLFAWSITGDKPFPFDYYLCFIFAASPVAVSSLMTISVQLTPSEEETHGDAAGDSADSCADSAGDNCNASFSSDEQSLMLSLAGSFATNPVGDTLALNVPMMVQANLQQHGLPDPTDAVLRVDHLHEEELRHYPMTVTEEVLEMADDHTSAHETSNH